jgi:hypothetical protein
MSIKTLSFSLPKPEQTIFTKVENFLKFPAFKVISSMYCDVNSPVHRSFESESSISRVSRELATTKLIT